MDITLCTKKDGSRCTYCGEPLDLEGECPNACTLDPNYGLVEELDILEDDCIQEHFQ
jgi:hypothetical protein